MKKREKILLPHMDFLKQRIVIRCYPRETVQDLSRVLRMSSLSVKKILREWLLAEGGYLTDEKTAQQMLKELGNDINITWRI